MAERKQERRRYFRVSDLVGLNYRLLSEDERELAMDARPSSLKTLLGQIEEQINVALASMKNSSPELHTLLDLYNQKINLAFGHGLADASQETGQSIRACRVNLSACGIAFACDDQPVLNQHMQLDLILYPSNLRLQLIAAVIACEAHEGEDGAYLIRADFVNIADADQEMLVQHVIKRQAQQLKEQREEAEKSDD